MPNRTKGEASGQEEELHVQLSVSWLFKTKLTKVFYFLPQKIMRLWDTNIILWQKIKTLHPSYCNYIELHSVISCNAQCHISTTKLQPREQRRISPVHRVNELLPGLDRRNGFNAQSLKLFLWFGCETRQTTLSPITNVGSVTVHKCLLLSAKCRWILSPGECVVNKDILYQTERPAVAWPPNPSPDSESLQPRSTPCRKT